jgi:hypothetical protein
MRKRMTVAALARLWPPSWTLPQLLAGRDPMDVCKKDWLVDELKKALSERILKQRLASIWMASIEGMSNHRNGYS